MDRDALVWCLVCKEGLCSDCKKYHTALKVLKSHEMIPYENLRKLPQIAQDIRETCLEHDGSLKSTALIIKNLAASNVALVVIKAVTIPLRWMTSLVT
jgi:hypothetical protein